MVDWSGWLCLDCGGGGGAAAAVGVAFGVAAVAAVAAALQVLCEAVHPIFR